MAASQTRTFFIIVDQVISCLPSAASAISASECRNRGEPSRSVTPSGNGSSDSSIFLFSASFAVSLLSFAFVVGSVRSIPA